MSMYLLKYIASILFNITEILMDIYMAALLEYNTDLSIRVNTDCSIRVYRSIFKRAHVPLYILP